MTAAAGALALAAALPPANSGAASPAGAPGDATARPFEGLLADGVAANAVDPSAVAPPPEGDHGADAGAAATDTTGTNALPQPLAAAPPPMDDPATRSVLNALALRVATEARAVAAPASGAGVLPATGAVADTGFAGARLLDAPNAITTPTAPSGAPMTANTALAAASAGQVAALAAAAAANALGAAPRSSAASTCAMPLAGLDAAGAESASGSLDALLSTLDALLPGAPAPSTPAAPASTASPPVAAVAPGALPAAPAMAPASGLFANEPGAAGALPVDPAGADAAGEAPSAVPSPGASVVGGGTPSAVPFSIQLAAATTSAGAAPRADGTQPPIQVPFDSPQWGNELATRVVSLAREQFSEAEIRVTPDELGPIEVKLRFEGDRVHAQFGAISPEAREALTANLHRLREMLAGEGLNLGQAFVGHHGQDAGRRFDGQAARGGGSSADGSDEDAPIAPRIAIAARRGLLDEFA